MYAGTSVAKDYNRKIVFDVAKKALGNQWSKSDMLFFASKEGGDIGQALSMGVHPSRITAIDKDTSAVKAARRKFPGIDIRNAVLNGGDCADLICERAFDFVFVDSCGPICSRTQNEIGAAISQTKFWCNDDYPGFSGSAIISFTGLIGRESGLECEIISDLVSYYQAHTNDHRKALSMARAAIVTCIMHNITFLGRCSAEWLCVTHYKNPNVNQTFFTTTYKLLNKKSKAQYNDFLSYYDEGWEDMEKHHPSLVYPKKFIPVDEEVFEAVA